MFNYILITFKIHKFYNMENMRNLNNEHESTATAIVMLFCK